MRASKAAVTAAMHGCVCVCMCVCVCVTQGGRGKGVFEFDNRNLSYMHPSITFKTHYTSQQLQFNAGCIVDLSTKQELTG